jgi:hypothetical protein
MVLPRPAGWLRLASLLAAALLVAACGASASPGNPPGFGPRSRPITPTPAVAATPRPASSPVGISPYTVVRTYADARGRTITLYYGRAVGRRGDWGWAHIIGKHLKGEWLDGGPITTFGVIGITTPEAVQEIIGRAVREDGQPDDVARGRREYRLPVQNGRYEVLTVVGSDGAIITAYPDGPREVRR